MGAAGVWTTGGKLMTDQQRNAAEAIAQSLMQQGADPVNVAQITALAAGMVAKHAPLEPDVYRQFVAELAQALIHEAGLSNQTKVNIQ